MCLATQLDLIQKYAGADAKKPKLNRLGGQELDEDPAPGTESGTGSGAGTGGTCMPVRQK